MPDTMIELTCGRCGTELLYDKRPDNRYQCCVCRQPIEIDNERLDPRQIRVDPTEREARKL